MIESVKASFQGKFYDQEDFSVPKKKTIPLIEKRETCHSCGRDLLSHDTIHLSEGMTSKPHCSKCFNQLIAEMNGLEFEHAEFQPVVMKDVDGHEHTFHFRGWLTGGGYSIEGFELMDGHRGGYQFQVLGDPEGDSLELWGTLFQKMRRELGRKHVEETDLGLEIRHEKPWEVRAAIHCDLETGRDTTERLPLLVIDGREVAWERFGRMLMTFEGFRFKLEIYDKSEER